MSNAGNSKKDRREQAREVAREMREAERKRRRRNRFFLQGGVVVAVIAVAVVVVLVVVSVNKPKVVGPGPANMASGGIQFSGTDAAYTPTPATAAGASATPTAINNADGKAHIVEYIDWSCPICQTFETTYASDVLSLVKSGTATVEFHPVAILDRSSLGARYSSRSANVAACVANYDPSHYLDVQTAFYANQPAENTTGLTNAKIIDLLTSTGVDVDKKYSDGNSIADCVNKEQFKDWVSTTTASVVSDANIVNPSTGTFGTPTVFVNGYRWDGKTDFPTFIQEAVAEATTSTSTPTPAATN